MPVPFRAAFAGAAMMGLAGCVATTTPVVAVAPNPYPAPPAIVVETVPPPPISDNSLIWQPGHWDWSGSAYVWTAGAWVSRIGHGGNWQQGYWTPVNGVWTWIPAHWV